MVEIHKHRDGLLTGTCLWSPFERMGGLFARVAAGGGPFVFVSMIFSKSLLLFLLLPALAVLLKIVVTFLDKKKDQELIYLKKDSLLTEAEKSFYSVLKNIIADNYLLFPQVSLLEILAIPKELSKSRRYSSLNRIQAKHIDFLLCEKESIKPLLAIELDDSSHYRADRMMRDDFLNQAFATAGLPLLHIKTAFHYDQEKLSEQIKQLLVS